MNWFTSHLSAHATALQAGDLAKLGVLLSADILVLFSIASFAIVFERALALSRARRLEDSEYKALRDSSRRGSSEEARAIIARSDAPSASAVRAGLDLQRDLQSHSANSPASARELAREAVGQGLEEESAKLSRNLPILATVASTAPYIGLFGTVLGILSAFARIAQTGQTGASAVAAPISEALTATGMGLGVAIPAVMAYNFLSSRVGDLMMRVETHALDLSARLIGGDGHAANTSHSNSASTSGGLAGAPALVATAASGSANNSEAKHAG